MGPECVCPRAVRDRVGLIPDDDLRLLCQRRAVLAHFSVDGLIILNGVAALCGCNVDHVHEQSAALYMP